MNIGFRSNKKDNMKKIAPLLNIPLLLAMASLCIVVLPLRAGSVSLGDAAGFAVLADSTLTNTGPTTLFGDLGGAQVRRLRDCRREPTLALSIRMTH